MDMRLLLPLCLVHATPQTAAAGKYVKNSSLAGADFFSMWDFDDSPDPTSGHVIYVDRATAMSKGLVNATQDRVYMGPDLASRTGGSGRQSVRVRSKDAFDSGLFIITVDHVPTGCSTWPAFWMYGEDPEHPWPAMGEYDVIEGVNNQAHVTSTLHTTDGCDQSGVRAGEDMTGRWAAGSWKEAADNCYIHAPGQYDNQGCIQQGAENSIGTDFNKGGGGTYAAEWAPHHGHIRTWFWPRGREPQDVVDGAPDPSQWGTPYSYFRLDNNCPKEHFARMRFMFDLSFCGDWAGGTFTKDCPWLADQVSCEDLVSFHPEELREAYWSLRVLDVYSWAADEKEPADGSLGATPSGGSGFNPWHLMIAGLILLQTVVLCGIGLLIYRVIKPKEEQDDAERGTPSVPSSPTRPLVLGPASPGALGAHTQHPGRMQAGTNNMAARTMFSRIQSAPNRLGPNFRLNRF